MSNTTKAATSTGPWDNSALATLREWDSVWAGQTLEFANQPWTDGVLPRKEVELISLAVSAACTTRSAGATRRHIRGALEAGATRDEILMILKIASLLALHTCSLGAPILLEEAKSAGVKLKTKEAATPVCDKMKAGLHDRGYQVREVNIDDDPELTRRYGVDIPVAVRADGTLLAKHRLSAM